MTTKSPIRSLDPGITLTRSILVAVDVHGDGMMDDFARRRGVSLGKARVGTRNPSMLMPPVTKFVEPLWEGGVEASNPPRLEHGKAPLVSVPSDKTVHAPVEVGILESQSAEESGHTLFSPRAAAAGPLNEAHGPHLQTLGCHNLEVLP